MKEFYLYVLNLVTLFLFAGFCVAGVLATHFELMATGICFAFVTIILGIVRGDF